MAQELSDKEFVSIQELVEICGLSDSTLYRLAKQHKLPGAGWEAVDLMNRDNSSGLLMPRYQWTIHLETFMAWWTQHLEKNRQQNRALSRLKPSDFPPVQPRYTPAPQKVETESPAVIAVPLGRGGTRKRITDDVKRYIALCRLSGFTALQIHAKMVEIHGGIDDFDVPSASSIRRIAQEWDDKSGRPHLEPKRTRLTKAEYAARKAAPAATEFTSSEFIQEVQTYEHNIGDMVRMSNATHFICSECKKGRRNPERLSLSIVRPGRSEQKDVVTHLLCSAVCAIKFIETKEEQEWSETTLKRVAPHQREITFPLPNTAPPKKSQTGSLWRRFRDLVGGNG